MDVSNALSSVGVNRAKSLANAQFSTNNKDKLKEQTDNFEAIFVKQILDESMSASNALFGHAAGDEIYKSMYTDALSQKMAGSFGYSQVLYDYLTRK